LKKKKNIMLKRIALLLIFALPIVAFAQDKGGINWMTIEEAVEAQKENPKKIMIDVYTSWCGPCKMMDRNTFSNPDVIEYVNENFYAVKFNAESPDDVQFKGETYSNPNYEPNKRGRNGVNQFSRALGVRAYPTLVYMDEDAVLITAVSGYRTPQQLELYLKLFNSDKYKEIKSEEDLKTYQEGFTPEFEQ